ncbi:MAG: hypothetical protein RSD07_03265 [Angelakisella sp.]
MKPAKSKLFNNKGITLVETIVASLLLVMGTLILSTGFVASARMMTASGESRKAAQSVTGTMNGGGNDGTTASGKPIQIRFSAAGLDFTSDVTMESFRSTKDEMVSFYRLRP